MRQAESTSNSDGFSLIEALVALLVGLGLVLGLGNLGQRLVHHRTTTNSNSAAMAYAEQQMEKILADQNPRPSGGSCPSASLCAGSHSTTVGQFTVQWTVTDSSTSTSSPLILSSATNTASFTVKKITVSVTHSKNPMVSASITRLYDVDKNVAS
jgi:Tfp pilus assembly protein PilV